MMERVEVGWRGHQAGSVSGFLLVQLSGHHSGRGWKIIVNRGERLGTSDHRPDVDQGAGGLGDRPVSGGPAADTAHHGVTVTMEPTGTFSMNAAAVASPTR